MADSLHIEAANALEEAVASGAMRLPSVTDSELADAGEEFVLETEIRVIEEDIERENLTAADDATAALEAADIEAEAALVAAEESVAAELAGLATAEQNEATLALEGAIASGMIGGTTREIDEAGEEFVLEMVRADSNPDATRTSTMGNGAPASTTAAAASQGTRRRPAPPITPAPSITPSSASTTTARATLQQLGFSADVVAAVLNTPGALPTSDEALLDLALAVVSARERGAVTLATLAAQAPSPAASATVTAPAAPTAALTTPTALSPSPPQPPPQPGSHLSIAMNTGQFTIHPSSTATAVSTFAGSGGAAGAGAAAVAAGEVAAAATAAAAVAASKSTSKPASKDGAGPLVGTSFAENIARYQELRALEPAPVFVKVPVQRGVKVLGELIDLTGKHNAAIVGGAARWMLSPHGSPSPADDVDIFCKTVADADGLFAALTERHGYACKTRTKVNLDLTYCCQHCPASLFVNDLHATVTAAMLHEIFNPVGPIVSIDVCRDAITRKSRGYAYVNYAERCDAVTALHSLNGVEIGGRPCRIKVSQRHVAPAERHAAPGGSACAHAVGSIIMKNLDTGIDAKALKETFAAFGEVTSSKIIADSTGGPHNVGYVHFAEQASADVAVQKVDGMLLNGIVVDARHDLMGTAAEKIQLILPRKSKYMRCGASTLEEQLSFMDFTVSRVAMLDRATGLADADFVKDETKQDLVIRHIVVSRILYKFGNAPTITIITIALSLARARSPPPPPSFFCHTLSVRPGIVLTFCFNNALSLSFPTSGSDHVSETNSKICEKGIHRPKLGDLEAVY